jgi:tetratricopeptide (TPR) repeat protein
MYKFLLIIGIVIFFVSCGNEVKDGVASKILIQDTTISQQEKEFIEINQLLKADVNNAFLYLRRAYLYKKYEDVASAVSDVDRAIKVDSLQPEFYLLKAELLKQEFKLVAAKDVLDQVMFIDNENLKARIELGWLALVARDYKQALAYADAVLKRDVYNAEAYFLKGLIFEDKGDTTFAISSFTTAIEQENDYYDAYIHLGLLHLKQGSFKLAKGYLKNALRVAPKSLEALYAFALVCQDKGDYNEAIAIYHTILTMDKFAEPYFNLGFIHQEYLKVYSVAIENYTKAIEIEPNYLNAYYNRALCYEQQQELNAAEKDLRTALRLDPQYTNAALVLERVLNSITEKRKS